MTEATRDRMISAAIALFAERGTRGTAVGDIEQAAGLTRRGGAFYKHFSSKDEILTAGIERHIAQAQTMLGLRELFPLGDLRSELTLMCRVLLQVLEAEHQIMRVLEREGDQHPQLGQLMLERLLQPGATEAVAFIERWLPQHPRPGIDVEATATIMLGSIVNHQRTRWTFGSNPFDIDKDRFVGAWVQTWVDWFGPSRADTTEPTPESTSPGKKHTTPSGKRQTA